MPEHCKHGLEMTHTCRKCGRVKVAQASDFAAKKEGFLTSIDRLEETVRRMQAELAKGPSRLEQPAETEQPEIDQPPPTPPQRYPWQRS